MRLWACLWVGKDINKKALDKHRLRNKIGGNGGYTQSNTLALENKKAWREVLIEPSPHLFLSCCHFKEKEGKSIHCCACVPFDYQEKYVDID